MTPSPMPKRKIWLLCTNQPAHVCFFLQQDIKSTTFVIEFNSQRMMVKDTDKGKQLVTQIQDLKKLLVAYRTGFIKEKEIF